jgi:hypothetical protein
MARERRVELWIPCGDRDLSRDRASYGSWGA